MDLSGFVQFGMDLAGGDEAKSVSPEHTALLLVLCWKFKAKSFGIMGIEGFVAGCEAIKCSTIEEIASRSGTLLAEISSSSKHVDPSRRSAADDRFQAFHSYVYDILRPEGKKYIEKVSDNAEEDVRACVHACTHTKIQRYIFIYAHMHAYIHTCIHRYTRVPTATRQPIPSPTPFCLASFQLVPSLSPSSFTFFTDCTPFLA